MQSEAENWNVLMALGGIFILALSIIGYKMWSIHCKKVEKFAEFILRISENPSREGLQQIDELFDAFYLTWESFKILGKKRYQEVRAALEGMQGRWMEIQKSGSPQTTAVSPVPEESGALTK